MSTETRMLVGQRHGTRVVARVYRAQPSYVVWRCDCGSEGSCPVGGFARSGCTFCKTSRAGKAATHGLSYTPEYRTWRGMLARCYTPSHSSYAYYGGRGIRVCEQWRDSFQRFFADMGQRPTAQHSIDRFPDRSGDYEPGNVRWATAAQQIENHDDGWRSRAAARASQTRTTRRALRAWKRRGTLYWSGETYRMMLDIEAQLVERFGERTRPAFKASDYSMEEYYAGDDFGHGVNHHTAGLGELRGLLGAEAEERPGCAQAIGALSLDLSWRAA